MAANSQKPLPSVPRHLAVSQHLMLTIEAREHRKKFLKLALAEDPQVPFSDAQQDLWVVAFESALDSLAESVASGGWLLGLKRSRKAKKARRDHEKSRVDGEQSKKEKETTIPAKPRAKPSPDQSQSPDERPPNCRQNGSKLQSAVSRGETIRSSLQEIRDLVSQPAVPTPRPCSKHLLLCLAPIQNRVALLPLPGENSVLSLGSSEIACVFSASVFALPEAHSDDTQTANVILYGLDDWEGSDDGVRIVGGTFSFNGVSSSAQQQVLSKLLRISIYLHLSLLLEQAFLSNSDVKLEFPPSKPHQSTSPVPIPKAMERRPTAFDVKPKSKNPFLSGGILSFFSKKTESFLHRTTSISPILGRGSSLDLVRSDTRHGGGHTPRASEDNGSRGLRRFSFITDGRASPVKPPQDDTLSELPYASALRCIEKSRDLLSTSVGVSFAPPPLLVNLAEREKDDPSRRLNGDERAGLTSILGWEGKEARGRGMAGTQGFLRQQGFSVLFAQHVPATLPASPPASDTSKPGSVNSSSPSHGGSPPYAQCDRPRWITYRYYARDNNADKTLGEAIMDLCSTAEEPCTVSGCQSKRGEHEMRLVHSGIRIVVKVNVDDKRTGDREDVEMWASCNICHAKTERKEMSDGTYLYSFGKFLEVLVYSPAICTLSPSLCEHTTPPPRPWPSTDSPLPRSRLNIARYFSFGLRTVSITLTAIKDIFELRVPRLQILRSMTDKPLERRREHRVAEPSTDEEKRVLRREISSWWQGVSEHIDKLEESCSMDRPASFHKSLPRLPSADDAYDDLDAESSVQTPKAGISGLPPLPPSTPSSPAADHGTDFGSDTGSSYAGSSYAGSESGFASSSDGSDGSATSRFLSQSTNATTYVPPDQGPDKLLSSLRHSFHRTEQSLHAQLARTPVSSLNEVRRSFLSTARGANKRLSAWQTKHLPHTLKGNSPIGKLSVQEPEWWNKTCHVEGGGNVIVRESDWGSIISFALSSSDFQLELAKMSGARSPAAVSTPEPSAPSNTSSFFSSAKLFSSNAIASPDPDQEGIVWHEPETYSAAISRKDHPRDPTNLLSLKEVLRQKTVVEGSNGLPSSRFASLTGRNVSSGTPPTAWAKPAVEVSMQAADGFVSGLPAAGGSAGRILQEMDAVTSDSVSRPSSIDATTSSIIEPRIRRGHASITSTDSDTTIGPETTSSHDKTTPSQIDLQSRDDMEVSENRLLSDDTPTQSSFAVSLTNTLTNAVRYVMNTGDIPRPVSPTFKNKHGLLSIEALGIDERPHIQYDWTIGKRLKFSCTVYYAKQFDALRRRCGLGDVFLKSLGKSANWAAEGGKSKSNFWKTADDRYIIKTLVNAWNVADLQVLIELAPSYFRYMDATSSKPTVLAKLLGFYTVEVKNLESGNTQAKADLLVMENIFFDQTISKTFDLKGIHGRKVKPGPVGSNLSSKTLFDGEWIEGQQRTLTLVRPHSKVVLREAIKRDSDFLSQSNIMDYSLLLGIDEERRQIACGLVDTIGSYTFAKTLEYKAKQGLNGGKAVTVVPPVEYQERFVNAIEGYFLACPDKWSRPLDDTKILNDPNLLPSVL